MASEIPRTCLLPAVFTPANDVLQSGADRFHSSDIFPEGVWSPVYPEATYHDLNVTERSPLNDVQEMLREQQRQLNREPDRMRSYDDRSRVVLAVNMQTTLVRCLHQGFYALLKSGYSSKTAIAGLNQHIEDRDQQAYDSLTRRLDDMAHFRSMYDGATALKDEGDTPLPVNDPRRDQYQRNLRETQYVKSHLQHLAFEWLSARAITQHLEHSVRWTRR